MTKEKILTVFYMIFAVMLFSSCVLAFFIPFFKRAGAAQTDEYDCVWQNGAITRESYFSAYASLCGLEGENIVLERDGLIGCIPSPETAIIERVLRYGSLVQLLALDCSQLSALERAALVHNFAKVVYYGNHEYFAFTGTGVERTRQTEAQTLSLLTGTVPSTVIGNSRAKEVWLSPETDITAKAFIGTRVERIMAQEPYLVYGDALYLNTAGGRRLITALPNVKTLCIEGNDFADEGALLPCEHLEEVTLSFAGSHKSGIGSDFRGEFAYLFSDGNGYAVPPSLKKITVTGGKLITHAFYACAGVEEIYACGLKEEDIDEHAFIDCESLRVLHVPKTGIVLPDENYDIVYAPCGCTVYERRGS